MTTKIKVIIGVSAAVLGGIGFMYLKRPAAKIVIHSDGSYDATLGSKAEKYDAKTGLSNNMGKTWNGWELYISTPIAEKGYSLTHNGKIMMSSTGVTPTDTGDTYVEIVHD